MRKIQTTKKNAQADHGPFERKYQEQPSKIKANNFNAPRSIRVHKPTKTLQKKSLKRTMIHLSAETKKMFDKNQSKKLKRTMVHLSAKTRTSFKKTLKRTMAHLSAKTNTFVFNSNENICFQIKTKMLTRTMVHLNATS